MSQKKLIRCFFFQVVPGFWYNWHSQICIGYSLTALTAEINSFFLHSRKLLQINQVGFDTLLYRTCSYLNLVTFFFCRIIPIGFIVYHLFGVEGEIHRQKLSAVYVLCFRIIMLIVAIINVILFWRLFKTDIIRPLFKKKSDKTYIVNGNNNDAHCKKENWYDWGYLTDRESCCNRHLLLKNWNSNSKS